MHRTQCRPLNLPSIISITCDKNITSSEGSVQSGKLTYNLALEE